jgi:hypothetical protein
MTYKWTFMVYMAGDNGKFFNDGNQLMADLQQAGWSDIKEMSEVGSTAEVAIVVQYDTLDERQYTPRFFIDGSTHPGQLIEKIPPVNTGDAKNLTDFIVWGETHYPAKHYALVLWNHGTGWKEDDIYERYREVSQIGQRDQVRAVQSRRRLLRRALFLPTTAGIMGVEDDEVRGICYDDSSMDFLDNQDLAKALDDAENRTGQHLAVLGMDACLMSMVEVAYQIRKCADYMVGSQEVELAEGWPYKNILGTLVGDPEMTPLDLSRLIVDKFGEFYMGFNRTGGGNNTQSAIDLQLMPETFSKVKALSGLVTQAYLSQDFKTEIAIMRAKQSAQGFTDTDYVDLQHLVRLVRDEYTGDLKVADLAGDLFEHLTSEKPGSPIVKNFRGRGRPEANGLSIYFPARRYSPFYDRQVFALSGWNRVIRQANRLKAPQVTPVDQLSGDQATRTVDVRRIICSICDGVVDVPTNIGEVGLTIGTKTIRDIVTQIAMAIQQALASPTTESNSWIDLPCPHCGHTFQYNVKTEGTR